jgi:hypothetical protein
MRRRGQLFKMQELGGRITTRLIISRELEQDRGSGEEGESEAGECSPKGKGEENVQGICAGQCGNSNTIVM